MTESKKRRSWITITVIALIILGVLFSPQTTSVRALFGNGHIAEVLFRFWNEVLSKSPAGQYYQDLAWKHADELNQILSSHQEHRDKEFFQTVQMIIPGLEALVDGRGDTVQITEEQISSLKAELDWIYSFASPSLREDIEKEQQRFPLDDFIGMTISEALDYVNSNWVPITQVIPLSTPTVLPTAAAVIPICLIGPDPDCQEKPTLVPDSNGLWASYILNGVYFEYPSTERIQQSETRPQQEVQNIYFTLPASSSPEEENIIMLSLNVGNYPVKNTNEVDPLEIPETILMRPTPMWKRPVSLLDFQGVAFLQDYMYPLEVFLYNESDQIAVDLIAMFKDTQTAEMIDSLEVIEKVFPNLQHLIESIRIWKP